VLADERAMQRGYGEAVLAWLGSGECVEVCEASRGINQHVSLRRAGACKAHSFS
jgi:hypothetical protein